MEADEMSRRVAQIDALTDEIIRIYPTITAAMKACWGASGAGICGVCSGRLKTSYGYKWRYVAKNKEGDYRLWEPPSR